jgi:phosphatidate cytidylyltransferase
MSRTADNEKSPRVAKSNLAIRLLTVAVVAPVLLCTLFLGPPIGWYAIIFGASLVGASELFAMTHPGDRIAQAIGVVTTGGVSLAVYFGSGDPRVLLTVIAATTIVGALIPLWRLGKIEDAALRILAGIAGPFYVGGLVTMLALLRRDQGPLGPPYVLLTLMIAWLGDTGGYFAGRFLGKTKLYEAVSPKKTREGFAGSVVGSICGAMLAHFWYLPSLPLGNGFLLATLGGVLGQMGDLIESLLKRSTGIKDSGWIVPGHGGILDRIDALLIVSPIVYLYTVWFG